MYPNHSLVHDLSGSYQRRTMSVILSAAQAAEDECKQFQDIARGMLASQGFFASASAGAGAGVYASQAEQTLTKYGIVISILATRNSKVLRNLELLGGAFDVTTDARRAWYHKTWLPFRPLRRKPLMATA